jgi:mRNA interferase MazF
VEGIERGDVWWANLPAPLGSGPGCRRPVIVVQGRVFNRSRISTVVCVPLTTNLRWENAPGNVLLTAEATGLPQDSVANASQIAAAERGLLETRVGRLSDTELSRVLSAIDVVLGR